MNKVITYSLFGYGKERHANSFDFLSYLRGVMICARMNRLLYPGWAMRVYCDRATYDYILTIMPDAPVEFVAMPDEPMCKAMLWRMLSCFEENTVVLCRDLDSPATYRERQCVEYWLKGPKSAHAITDSISHNIPMLGGMIAFKSQYFKEITGFQTWPQMVAARGFDYSIKGTDQHLINQVIYPKFAQPGSDSITQHYIKGMPNTFLMDYHSEVPNIQPQGIDPSLESSNTVCGHIGSAGHYNTYLGAFLRTHASQFEDLRSIERRNPEIFYWGDDYAM